MRVTIFFDGGTRAKDKIAAGGAVIYDQEQNELAAVARLLHDVITNNVAEYTGLCLGLETALALGATDAQVFGDSELVVRQVNGVYKARKVHLIPLRDRAWELGRQFDSIKIKETPRGKKSNRRRDNNMRADELCNACMDNKADINLVSERR